MAVDIELTPPKVDPNKMALEGGTTLASGRQVKMEGSMVAGNYL